MARRPSTVSVASFGSIKNLAELSHLTSASTFAPSPSAPNFPRSVPSTHFSSVQSTRVQDETADIDPDELFAKCTIPEVKAKQVQLRCVKTYPCQSPSLAQDNVSDLTLKPSRRSFVLWSGACSFMNSLRALTVL